MDFSEICLKLTPQFKKSPETSIRAFMLVARGLATSERELWEATINFAGMLFNGMVSESERDELNVAITGEVERFWLAK